jgi:hypothetical protein
MRWLAGVLAGTALLAAGCSSSASSTGSTGSTGTVAGTYIRVGGPLRAPDVPLPGMISFRERSGPTISINADSTGRFTVRLPSGTYAVTAESSLINDGKASCSRPLTTRVQADQTVTITLVCDIR